MVTPALLRRCQPLLERALSEGGGTHTLADIERLCAEGRLQQWDGPNSIIITEVLEAPQRKTLLFFLAAGKLQELRAMLPPILEWGKLQGCQAASFIGRFGWQRTFVRKFGFREQAIMMEADL